MFNHRHVVVLSTAKDIPTVISRHHYLILFTIPRYCGLLNGYCCSSHVTQESIGKRATALVIVRNSLNRPPLRIVQQYQRNLYIVEKYFQCATIPSQTMWVYLHSFSRCSRSNMATSAKFRENLNVQQFKVIQGRWFWYQSKGHMQVPISD